MSAPDPKPAPKTFFTRLRHTVYGWALIRLLLAVYDQYKHLTPAAFFMGGFTWDSLTLTRIDSVVDNVILLVYLLLAGVCIVLMSLTSANRIKSPFLLKYQEWFELILQFLLGGLFSAYVVFYFQSVSLTSTSIFLIVLILLLIGNEFFGDRFSNLYVHLILYFFACVSFFIFAIPVVFKVMSTLTFIVAGLLALGLIGGMLWVFYRNTVFETKRQFYQSCTVVVGAYLILNLFYALNWIPPVPLSLKHAGIYHEVRSEIQPDGLKTYHLTYEKAPWYRFWQKSADPFHYAEGDMVYCYTSVFAPTQLRKSIRHRWLQYNETTGDWVTVDDIPFEISGIDRDRGYRGYTRKRNVEPGRWRVDIRTEDERLLGRLTFDIVRVETHPRQLLTTTDAY